MMIPYTTFGQLRLKDFYPKDVKLSVQQDGFECALGHSGSEGFATTYFAWPIEHPCEIGEISLDFKYDDELPSGVGHAILDALSLPLRSGLTEREVLQALGTPIQIDWSVPEISSLAFLVRGQEKSLYRVECNIHAGSGLVGVGVVREDMRESTS